MEQEGSPPFSQRAPCVAAACEGLPRWALPRGRVAPAGAELTGLVLGESLAHCSMSEGALRELPLRVTLGPAGCHFQTLLPKGNFLVHLGSFRKDETTGASSLVCSADHPELQGEILAQGVSERFIVINIFQSMLLSLQNLTYFSIWKEVFLALHVKAFHLSSHMSLPGGDVNDSFFFFLIFFFLL